MICKNCQSSIPTTIKFCPNCGAEVIHQRITFKKLRKEFFNTVFGWDNKFFFTLKKLVVEPDVLLNEYVNGTRKKYVRPFTFLAIGAAISILIFNQFHDEYMSFSRTIGEKQTEIIDEQLSRNKIESNTKELTEEELKAKELEKEEDLKMHDDIQRNILKYLNVVTFILLPFYAVISLFVFGKRYNYGEHLIINSYLQGFLFISGTILFLGSIFIHPTFYLLSIFISILYYLYVFGKLYQHSFGVLVLKFFKFLAIVLMIPLSIFVLGHLVGYIKSHLVF